MADRLPDAVTDLYLRGARDPIYRPDAWRDVFVRAVAAENGELVEWLLAEAGCIRDPFYITRFALVETAARGRSLAIFQAVCRFVLEADARRSWSQLFHAALGETPPALWPGLLGLVDAHLAGRPELRRDVFSRGLEMAIGRGDVAQARFCLAQGGAPLYGLGSGLHQLCGRAMAADCEATWRALLAIVALLRAAPPGPPPRACLVAADVGNSRALEALAPDYAALPGGEELLARLCGADLPAGLAPALRQHFEQTAGALARALAGRGPALQRALHACMVAGNPALALVLLDAAGDRAAGLQVWPFCSDGGAPLFAKALRAGCGPAVELLVAARPADCPELVRDWLEARRRREASVLDALPEGDAGAFGAACRAGDLGRMAAHFGAAAREPRALLEGLAAAGRGDHLAAVDWLLAREPFAFNGGKHYGVDPHEGVQELVFAAVCEGGGVAVAARCAATLDCRAAYLVPLAARAGRADLLALLLAAEGASSDRYNTAEFLLQGARPLAEDDVLAGLSVLLADNPRDLDRNLDAEDDLSGFCYAFFSCGGGPAPAGPGFEAGLLLVFFALGPDLVWRSLGQYLADLADAAAAQQTALPGRLSALPDDAADREPGLTAAGVAARFVLDWRHPSPGRLAEAARWPAEPLLAARDAAAAALTELAELPSAHWAAGGEGVLFACGLAPAQLPAREAELLAARLLRHARAQVPALRGARARFERYERARLRERALDPDAAAHDAPDRALFLQQAAALLEAARWGAPEGAARRAWCGAVFRGAAARARARAGASAGVLLRNGAPRGKRARRAAGPN